MNLSSCDVSNAQRLWNGGIATLTGAGRGRGGSVDRGGRIRSGRGLLYSYYPRGIGYDDSGDGNRIESQSYQVKVIALHTCTNVKRILSAAE